jgi:hypothetical protein
MTLPLIPGAIEAAKRLADYSDTMTERTAAIMAEADAWESARIVKQQGFWARRDARQQGGL